MKKIIDCVSLLLLVCIATVLNADSNISKSPEGAEVFIIEPVDGASVSDEFAVLFGITGMDVKPAGTVMENSGHHHLLIDVSDSAMPDLTLPLPTSDNVIHFGKGQTETMISLTPGEHTLQIVLGNHLHIPHDPPVISERITIQVE